ncbi:peptidoglycan editing factor PgeF [Shewanella japonica]|uniref:peptidoglycan editing factor PgeF n=1 Tax=Shewanella japonica TaxID=93973 RepID=UPI00249437A5|nr:peptidoglycan editing factor PgeF [Shewanella japonica]
MYHVNWPIPDNIGIAMTDRHGGVSQSPFDSLNLGLHVGDAPQDVLANRALIQQTLAINVPVTWLDQVHGTTIIDYSTVSPANISPQSIPPKADGSYVDHAKVALAVMTADCLPVLLCNKAGTEIAAVHAGWRGLCDGVIESAIKRFNAEVCDIIAYLGPAIGPNAFEVGAEVKQQFVEQDIEGKQWFKPHGVKYLADLCGLATMRLSKQGIKHIYSANVCTFTNPDYFSYRRDQQTGRMASFIWLKS